MIKPLPPSIFRENSRRYGFLLFLFFSFFLSVGAFAQTVTTDKDDYAPRSNAVFSGSGFAANENVVLKVKNLSRPCNTVTADSSYLAFTVRADISGNFTTNWTVCDCLGDSLRLKAQGQTSGLIAYAYFTDGILGNVEVGSQTGTATSGTNASITYDIKLTKTGGGAESYNLTISGLPSGANPIFSLNSLSLASGNNSTANATLTINTTSALAAGTYNFTVTGTNIDTRLSADTKSRNGTLIVRAPACTAPSITTQPTSNNSTFTYGNNTSFSVIANGTTTLKYQWEEFITSWNPVSDEGIYSGTTTATLTLTKPTVAMSGRKYRVVVSACSPAQTTTSNGNATLTVNKANQTFTWATPTAITYGTALSATQLNASVAGVEGGTAAGELTYAPISGTVLDAGPHTLSVTAAATDNYNAASKSVSLTVTPRAITVTPNANQSKVYGTNDPTFVYTPSEDLLAGNSFSGALARDAGSDVGQYAYTLGTLAAGNNYTLTLSTATYKFAITAKPVVVTPAALSKVYGAADPAFTFSNDASLAASAFTGALGRTAGETVAVSPYAYTLGNLSAGANYSLSLGDGNNFSITTRPITITAEAKSKTYGEADPGFTYAITDGSLVNTDAFTGTLTRDAGNNAGSYAITQGSVALSKNYDLTYIGANLTITKKEASVVVDAKTKVYGTADPALTGTLTGFLEADKVIAVYSRAAGETVAGGSYSISAALSPDAVLGNYEITNTSAALTIGKAASVTVITIAEGPFTYTGSAITPATVSVTGAGGLELVPTATYENNVNAGTVKASYTYAGDANHFGSEDSKTFSIGKAATTTVVTIAAGPFTYTGEAQTSATVRVTGAGGLNLTPAAEYTDNVDAGTATASYNYAETDNYLASADSETFEIGKANQTITWAAPAAITYGTALSPAQLNATVAGVTGGSVAGALSYNQKVGDVLNAGSYKVTVTAAATNNYNEASKTVDLTVNKAALTITAKNDSKTYDGLAYQGGNGVVYAGFVNSETEAVLKGTLAYTGTSQGAKDVNTYAITPGSLTSGNYTITFVDGTLNITKATPTVTAFAASNLVYDASAKTGTGSATGVGSPAEVLSPVTLSYVGTGSTNYTASGTAPTNAGSYTITASFAGNNNYEAHSSETVPFIISKATPTIALTAYDVIFDGNAHTATGSAKGVKDEVLAGLDLSKTTHTDAGTYATDSWSFTDVTGNYKDVATTTITNKIGKADATIAVEGYTGVYDGDAHGATGTATGVKEEDLSSLLNLGASFTDVPGGTANWIFDGNTNYKAANGSVKINISTLQITATFTASNKTYDGNTSATVTGRTLVSHISTDNVSLLGGTATFADKNVANGKTVTLTGATLAGTDADNYILTSVATTTAAITAKALVIGITAENKVYDGNTTAATAASITSGLVENDVVTVSSTNGAFNNKNAGTAKAVTADVSKSGADAGNYSANTTAATTADIIAKELIPAIVAKDKMFDNTTTATLSSQTVSGMVTGETVGLAVTAANFASKERGTHIVTATGLSLTGDALVISNYFLATGATATDDATIFIAPTVTLSTPAPVAVGTASAVTATLGLDVFNTLWIYTSPIANTKIVSSTQLNITSSTPVVYSVAMQYENGLKERFTTPSVYVVFYDPNAGFVTGGGFITSPEGAYKPLDAPETYLSPIGKANFGFVSKYEKGAKIPTGNTEFNYNIGNMKFASTMYEWLTVANARAQYKGSGKINGQGDYGFLLTAVDGEVIGKANSDQFRIKIWDKASGAIVYDNQRSAISDDAEITSYIAGGSIVIHQPKTTTTKSERVADAADMFTATKPTFTAYPNPVRENTTIEFAFAQDEAYSLEVYNVQGELVKQLPGGQAKANTPVQVKWDAANTAAGVYIIRLVTSNGIQNLRVIRE